MVVNSKLMFEPHVRSIAKRASRSLGILRRAWRIFVDPGLVVRCFLAPPSVWRCFWSYLLPLVKYCSPVWGSAAESHLRLLDRVVRSAYILSGGRVSCHLSHRRDVASLCMLYKIVGNRAHSVCSSIPETFVLATVTSIEIEKDRGSTKAISHCLRRVTIELADLQRRSQLSEVFGTERLWYLVLLCNLHSLLCRYYVLPVVFQPLLQKAGG